MRCACHIIYYDAKQGSSSQLSLLYKTIWWTAFDCVRTRRTYVIIMRTNFVFSRLLLFWVLKSIVLWSKQKLSAISIHTLALRVWVFAFGSNGIWLIAYAAQVKYPDTWFQACSKFLSVHICQNGNGNWNETELFISISQTHSDGHCLRIISMTNSVK